jgi:hypothetical protein
LSRKVKTSSGTTAATRSPTRPKSRLRPVRTNPTDAVAATAKGRPRANTNQRRSNRRWKMSRAHARGEPPLRRITIVAEATGPSTPTKNTAMPSGPSKPSAAGVQSAHEKA